MNKTAKLLKSSDGNRLAIVNPDAAGIDIADTEMQVCVPEDRDSDNNRRFGSFTNDLNSIVGWLQACKITTVAMEATGIYFLPLFLKLKDVGIEVLLANPRDVKNISGHKTDYADAEWLMVLHRYGLLKPCFQPDNIARKIRNISRQRTNLIQEAERHVQYMQKAMGLMNIKLSTVISDIMGLSGRTIIEAILDGQRNPERLASFAQPNCKAGKETIARSLEGTWDEDLLFLIGQSLKSYDFIMSQISECDNAILSFLKEYESAIESFDTSKMTRHERKKNTRAKNAPKIDVEKYAYSLWGTNVFDIPGLKDGAVLGLIGELGHDFIDKFQTAEAFCSWCNLVPNNKISGGKILSSKLPRKWNPVGQIFRMAATSAARGKDEMGNYYRRMKARSGGKQANVATAHKIARVFYTMVKKRAVYNPTKVGSSEKELLQTKIKRCEDALARLNKKYEEAC